jgi:hypothetical protein
MSDYSIFETSWIGSLSHKRGLSAKQICSFTNVNSTELMKQGLMATLSMLRESQQIFMHSG